jgi:hypothetical protein
MRVTTHKPWVQLQRQAPQAPDKKTRVCWVCVQAPPGGREGGGLTDAEQAGTRGGKQGLQAHVHIHILQHGQGARVGSRVTKPCQGTCNSQQHSRGMCGRGFGDREKTTFGGGRRGGVHKHSSTFQKQGWLQLGATASPLIHAKSGGGMHGICKVRWWVRWWVHGASVWTDGVVFVRERCAGSRC